MNITCILNLHCTNLNIVDLASLDHHMYMLDLNYKTSKKGGVYHVSNTSAVLEYA